MLRPHAILTPSPCTSSRCGLTRE